MKKKNAILISALFCFALFVTGCGADGFAVITSGGYTVVVNNDSIEVMAIQTIGKFRSRFRKSFSQQELVALSQGDTVPNGYSRYSLAQFFPPRLNFSDVTEKYFVRDKEIIKDTQIREIKKSRLSFPLLAAILLALGLFVCLGWKTQTDEDFEYEKYWQRRLRLLGRLIVATIGIVIVALIDHLETTGGSKQITLLSVQMAIAVVFSFLVLIFSSNNVFDFHSSTPWYAGACFISTSLAGILSAIGDQDAKLGGYLWFFLLLFALSILASEMAIVRCKKKIR